MGLKQDPYRVLGVSEQATTTEIRRAFRRLARAHHPDANPGDPGAAGRFKEAAAAYEVLGDPVRRAAYDRERHAQEARPRAAGAGDNTRSQPHRRPQPARPYPEEAPARPSVRSLFDLLETGGIFSFVTRRRDLLEDIEEDWTTDWERRFSLLDEED